VSAIAIPALFSGYNLWRPTLDASGWAVRPNGPDAGGATGTVVHVDTAGNDANDGSTPLLAVATLDRAWALLKTNNAGNGPAPGNHRLRFKRGQVHSGTMGQPETSGGFVWPGGLSATAPFIIEAYGTGADPIIATPNAEPFAIAFYGDPSSYVWTFDITFRPADYQAWLTGGPAPSIGPPQFGELRGERQNFYFENVRVEGYISAHRFVSDPAADNRTRQLCMHRCHFSRLYNVTTLGPGGDVVKPGGIFNGGTRSVLFSECTFGEVGEWRTHPSGAVYGTDKDQNIYSVWDSQHTLALGCVFARSSHAGFQGRGSTASTYNCFVTECPVPISGGHAQHNDGAPSTHDAYRFRGKHMWNTALGGADVSPGVNRGWGFTVGFCSDPSELAWNVIANNTQSTGVAGGIRTDSDDVTAQQTQANIDLLGCHFHHNLSVNWRMGLEVRYTTGAGAPWRLPTAMRFTDNEFYEADSGSTTILLGRPLGQGGTWSGNKIGGSGKLKSTTGVELTQAEAESAIASTLGTVDTTGWATAADTTLAKYLESIGYSAPNRNLEGLLAGLRALNRSSWTDNLRGSNINTWVRGRFAKPEPNYADPAGGPLAVDDPPPPPPPPVGARSNTEFPRLKVYPESTGLASSRLVHRFNQDTRQLIDDELPIARMNVTGTGTTRIVDVQVIARRKEQANGEVAAIGSKNGWVVLVSVESPQSIGLVNANDGNVVEKTAKTLLVRTSDKGRFRCELTLPTWAGVRAHAMALGRAGDVITVETGSMGLLMTTENSARATVDFGVDQTDASVVVTGQAWVSSGMRFFAQVVGEDALINQVGAIVTDVVDGVGYTVRAHAPNGHSGNISVDVMGMI